MWQQGNILMVLEAMDILTGMEQVMLLTFNCIFNYYKWIDKFIDPFIVFKI